MDLVLSLVLVFFFLFLILLCLLFLFLLPPCPHYSSCSSRSCSLSCSSSFCSCSSYCCCSCLKLFLQGLCRIGRDCLSHRGEAHKSGRNIIISFKKIERTIATHFIECYVSIFLVSCHNIFLWCTEFATNCLTI